MYGPVIWDHRRVHKDPALRVISIGFVTSLIANLRRLKLHNYLLLTSSKEGKGYMIDRERSAAASVKRTVSACPPS
jgi:hypothetical protein